MTVTNVLRKPAAASTDSLCDFLRLHAQQHAAGMVDDRIEIEAARLEDLLPTEGKKLLG